MNDRQWLEAMKITPYDAEETVKPQTVASSISYGVDDGMAIMLVEDFARILAANAELFTSAEGWVKRCKIAEGNERRYRKLFIGAACLAGLWAAMFWGAVLR